MTTFIVFAVLGLGAGVAYAMLAFGIVAIYKGSGVLNFAQGGVAMFAAFCYADLAGPGQGQAGLGALPATIVVTAGAALFGAALYLVVMRQLRNAPVLANLVATLGVLAALQGLATQHWGAVYFPAIPSLFPTHPVSIGGGAYVGADRLYDVGIMLIVMGGLWWLYGRTSFGRSTCGAQENEKGASLLGYSPHFIASLNWALGCALAAVAGIIIAPIAGLNTATLPLMILPALAAALLGRFRSFSVAALAAVAIGVIESLLTEYWSSQPGISEAIPFVAVIGAMVVTGRLIPQRGTLAEGRPPKTPAGKIHVLPALACLAGAILLVFLGNGTYQAAVGTSVAFGILALSLVVIAGYTGQISIAQMTFAGLGGLFLSKVTFYWGVPFPLSILVAALMVVPIGVLVGLPALRVRGVNLAVVTFALADCVTAVVFNNTNWTGGGIVTGDAPVTAPSIFGLSLDGFSHPGRNAAIGLAALVIIVVMVSNLRRSSSGRKMLAVRGNERAAAAAGISTARLKLQAFGLSSFIAGLGGGVLSYALNQATLSQFDASASISLITVAYIGGIASIGGAVFAGVVGAGGVLYVLLSGLSWYDTWFLTLSGILLVITVLFQPDGVVPLMQENWGLTKARVHARLASVRGKNRGGTGSVEPI
jgi:branched-subunit amino acid ABC-type transport system permease component